MCTINSTYYFCHSYSRYMQTCCTFSKNLLTSESPSCLLQLSCRLAYKSTAIILGNSPQPSISLSSSESSDMLQIVNSYFLVDLPTSLQQSSWGIHPNLPFLSSSDTTRRGTCIPSSRVFYTRTLFHLSIGGSPLDYSSLDPCRIFFGSS